MRHKDGHWVYVLDCGKVITWTADNKPLAMSGTHQGIAERKRVEAERREIEERLRQAQKPESLSRMAGAIAHNFNNQLQGVMGYLELVLDNISEDLQITKFLNNALYSARQ